MRIEYEETPSRRVAVVYPEDARSGMSSFAIEIVKFAGVPTPRVNIHTGDYGDAPSVRYIQAMHDATGVALELTACMNDAAAVQRIAARVNAKGAAA